MWLAPGEAFIAWDWNIGISFLYLFGREWMGGWINWGWLGYYVVCECWIVVGVSYGFDIVGRINPVGRLTGIGLIGMDTGQSRGVCSLRLYDWLGSCHDRLER